MPLLKLINTKNEHDPLPIPVWYEKNKWKFSDLGIDGSHTDNYLTFSFKSIKQDWLKRVIKDFILRACGTCALPVISNSCPHANACLTCVNFRTDHRYLDVHKYQLEKTKAIVSQAKQNGWQRQLEMNLTIQSNLEKIVTTLEATNDSQA